MILDKQIWPWRYGRVLCILGALPYVLALMFRLIPHTAMWWPFISVLISSYTGLIISFIAGSHWGLSQKLSASLAKRVLLCSNLLVILSWVGILFPLWSFSFLILILGLWFAFALDSMLFSQQAIDKAYLIFRLKMTIFVSLNMIILACLGQHQLW